MELAQWSFAKNFHRRRLAAVYYTLFYSTHMVATVLKWSGILI
jgi:hypothetical protein